MMKKKALKVTALVGIMTLMMVGFAGCKKTECELCGEKAVCSTYKSELLGDIEICKSCKKELEGAADALKDLFK